jgi:hypothetical protein
VFTLRIDTDAGSLGDVEHLYEFLRLRRVPGTWFVDVKSQEGFLWRYSQMQGQEIGIHCYEHKTYEDEFRNHENILKARHRFRDVKLGADGYAAPFGSWNANLAKVVKEFRFLYSSEFSWDYDNFPSEPWIDAKTRGILQVPVHPISIGTLRRQGYSTEDMIDYFKRVIEEKISNSEPLMFYHHPKDRHHEVLESIMSRAEAARAHVMTMGEYATWWRGRSSEGVQIRLKDNVLVADTNTTPRGYQVRVIGNEGKATIIPIDQKIRLDSVVWKWLPKPYARPDDIARVRAFNPRIPLTLAVDKLFAFRSGK